MTAYFFDSTAIVKRYVAEPGTEWVLSVVDPGAGHRIYMAGLSGVEVASAIARHRKAKGLGAADAASCLAHFRTDWAAQYRVVEQTRGLTERAMALAEVHALGGSQSVQLAAGLEVHRLRLSSGLAPLVMVSCDPALSSAASAEGLEVEDPARR